MTIALVPSLTLPGDRDWLAAALQRPGGLAGLTGPDAVYLDRAIAGLDFLGLVGLAEGAAEAALLYQRWLAVHGHKPEACGVWYNLGVAQFNDGDFIGAAQAQAQALALRPDFSPAALARGVALEAAGQAEQALATWRRALPPPEERLRLHNELGRLLEEKGRLGEAAAEMRASLLIQPDQPDVQQHLIHNRQRMACWPPLQIEVPGVDLATAALHCGPLASLALVDDPEAQKAAAADWIARKLPPVGVRLAPERGYRHDRIRLGYLSSDFCRHAMSFLIAEVLELHDRDAFEIYGYCASPEDGSDVRARVIAAMDHHVVIKPMDDATAAARIRADEIDILIDLNGLTRGGRLGLMRWKPAPVQMTYLGYIGPVPLPELDWLLCDEVTIPAEIEAAYAPRPLRIAECFQANDGQDPVLPQVTRASEGLPEAGFVFASFSHHYKLTEAMFAAWCSILHAVPGAVLWLVDDNPESRRALQTRAVEAGLDPSRLIFAGRVDPAHYRARMTLADLFLDTTPYNAGTVASDALRMGLPMVTLMGRAFAARMAASLLTRVGQPDCIAATMEDYVALAVGIATDPACHARLRQHLRDGAWRRTLGDVAGFTRNLEAALKSVRLTG